MTLAPDSRLEIAGPLTVETVSAVKARLEAAIAGRFGGSCDLGAVGPCDTAGVQLLCSAVATAARMGVPFRVATASAAVIEAAVRIGVSHEAIGLRRDRDPA
jgi:ABC-type transporter Mla MlaB component